MSNNKFNEREEFNKRFKEYLKEHMSVILSTEYSETGTKYLKVAVIIDGTTVSTDNIATYQLNT